MIVSPLGFRIIVRYARKPIWMPTAPSKLFRMSVLTRNFYDEDEVKQIQKLFAVYRAQMNSIGKFMEKEFYEPASRAGGIPTDFLKVEQKEDEEIFEENNRINKSIAQQKEEYFKCRVRDLEDKAMEDKFRREEAIIEASQKVSDYIRKNVGNPDSCVTPENFDDIVENAMKNPVSYEFFINKSGHILRPSK